MKNEVCNTISIVFVHLNSSSLINCMKFEICVNSVFGVCDLVPDHRRSEVALVDGCEILS